MIYNQFGTQNKRKKIFDFTFNDFTMLFRGISENRFIGIIGKACIAKQNETNMMNWKKNQSCATNFSLGRVLEDFPQIGPNRTVKFQSVNNKIFSPCWDLHQASQALESAILIMLQINLNITNHESLYIVAHIIGQEGKFKVKLNAQWSDVCF